MGLKKWRTVISINDQRLSNTAEAIGALNSLKGKKKVILKIQRNGKIKTIKIEEE